MNRIIGSGRAFPVAAAAALFLSVAASAAAAPAADADAGARALIAAGRINDALALLNNACQQRPGDFVAHYYRAYCYGASKQWDAARREYEACAGLRRDNADVYYDLGVVLNELGQFGAAAQAFEEALLLDPGRVDANFNCGLAYYFGRRPVQAIKYYREARTLAPEDPDILFYLALAYEEIDQKVALNLWREYLRRAPEADVAQSDLATARRHVDKLYADQRP